MLDQTHQGMIANSFCEAANTLQHAAQNLYELSLEVRRPHVIYRPSLSIDGNQWCALYGENIQDGVCGFGSSPREAMLSFDIAWEKKLQ